FCRATPASWLFEQYASSNNNVAWLFAISHGRLRKLADIWYSPYRSYRLHQVAPLQYRSASYDNSNGLWTITSWKLDPRKWRFTATGKRRVYFADVDRLAQ